MEGGMEGGGRAWDTGVKWEWYCQFGNFGEPQPCDSHLQAQNGDG
jgi:hypothetical protein